MGRKRVAAATGLSLGAALGMGATAEAADFSVINLNDAGPGSLRQAVLDANAAAGADRISFRSSLSGTLTLTTGALSITEAVDLRGPGADRVTVSGNGSSGVFNVNLTAAGQAVSIAAVKVTAGAAATGSAVFNQDANLTLSQATISGNTGTNAVVANLNPGALTIRSSTLSGNSTINYGGAVLTYGTGALAIESSTIYGNSAPFGAGILDFNSAGPITIRSSTVAGNTASMGGGGLGLTTAATTLTSTLVANNNAPVGPDIRDFAPAGAQSLAFSLVENTTGATLTTTGPNITGQDPKLGPLQANGGPTTTLALLRGSPALDKGFAIGSDQRGAPRPFDLSGVGSAAGGNAADIGAYERVLCGGKLVNRVGTPGADVLRGTKKSDGMLGLGGKDKLKGGAGKDGLCGGPGKDKLKGGGGNDVLLGQAGVDSLIGGKGKDKLNGGAGEDKQKQ